MINHTTGKPRLQTHEPGRTRRNTPFVESFSLYASSASRASCMFVCKYRLGQQRERLARLAVEPVTLPA